MTRVRATFHYAMRRFLVEDDLLGGSFAVRVEDNDVTITFPLAGAHDEDAATASPGAPFSDRFPERDEMALVEGAQDIHVTMGSGSISEGPTLEKVDVLRAEVILDAATFGAADFHGRGASSEVWERAKREVEGAGRAADAAIERLISWIRVRQGQVWLGLYGEDVCRVGSREVADMEAARRLPWPARLDMSFSVVEPDTPLNRERLDALRPLVEANSSPELAELLLPDARFIATSAEPPDPPRALLIAAVACEVKIKAFLRECASPEQAPLVELLLSNPRDWSVAAAALFDHPLRIVAGRCLKDEPGRDLWKRVNELFQRRNDLAHRGVVPSEPVTRDAISASRDVFAWLESIRPSAER